MQAVSASRVNRAVWNYKQYLFLLICRKRCKYVCYPELYFCMKNLLIQWLYSLQYRLFLFFLCFFQFNEIIKVSTQSFVNGTVSNIGGSSVSRQGLQRKRKGSVKGSCQYYQRYYFAVSNG